DNQPKHVARARGEFGDGRRRHAKDVGIARGGGKPRVRLKVSQRRAVSSSASRREARALRTSATSAADARSPGAIASGQWLATTAAIRSSFASSARKRGSTVAGSATTRSLRQAGPPPFAID